MAAGLLRAYAMWLGGTLDSAIPCSGNNLYEAGPHFARVVGNAVLAEITQDQTSAVRSPMDYAA
ncbi:MAG: hypothetical protein A2V70_02090 [Planctomycetes bacterium RBG_13_63_9]|nr:MAG: hypothetical protein A2V70_02090 [Planctomycetes bacterium RBG_13_63_9]